MADKKYPIGTKIKYITDNKDTWNDFYGKLGVIVGIEMGCPLIYLPDSVWASKSIFSTVDIPATVQCGWCDIHPTIKKNQQLLFDFACQNA